MGDLVGVQPYLPYLVVYRGSLHEHVLSDSLLRNLRVQIKAQGYNRSVILRYIEEVIAETYAMLATKGLDFNALVSGIKFPVTSQGYGITLTKMGIEATGILLGPINVAGMTWNAWLNQGEN